MTQDEDWRTTFRPDIPSAARVYDYLLGGKDNYPADRAVAKSMIAQLPNVQLAVRWNRTFLHRVVRYLIREAGLRQIVDIGAGLPTVGNTHEIARNADPEARVVYVDHDPVVLAHARSMLHGVPNTAIIEHDLLEPDGILADPILRRLIDVGEPTAFLFLSILHFVPDEADPAGLIATLLDPFPAGSHVAISHATPEHRPRGQRRRAGLRRGHRAGSRPQPLRGHEARLGPGRGRARPDLAARVAAGPRRRGTGQRRRIVLLCRGGAEARVTGDGGG